MSQQRESRRRTPAARVGVSVACLAAAVWGTWAHAEAGADKAPAAAATTAPTTAGTPAGADDAAIKALEKRVAASPKDPAPPTQLAVALL